MSNTDIGDPGSASQGGATTGGSSPKTLAANAAQTVKQEAANFASGARDKAVDKIEQQKQTASETLGDFANAIRRAGDELANSNQSMATRLVRQAADGLEGFARSVSDKRPEELLDAVRDFGRRNPTAFIAGSVLVGVALGRFLKSSSESAGSSGSAKPARFASPGGAPGFAGSEGGFASSTDLGEDGDRVITSLASAEVAHGGMSTGGVADPLAAGATSIGAPDSDLRATARIPEDLAEPRSDEIDRSRFGSES